MAGTGKRPQIAPRTALMFQGGIGVVGLAAIALFGIPVYYNGVSPATALFWGLAGSVATYAVILLVSRLPGLVRDSLESQLEQLHRFASDYSWTVLIALSVFAGVGEELLFRGAIQGWLAQHVHDAVAIVLASLLFGLVHYLSFTYFVLATGLGMTLGTVYALTDSLVLVMVWHGVYDMIALYCLRRFPEWFGVRVG
ncbi:CPBP family intramembrane glutamic endopeptidase [Marinobacter panjinensis]|uniref:CPBP family intramembrane glutamic endopeptidase n=1 Tax=Marinobacter panjinensis TaxID=2576384 RepID=UPI001D19172C|nr:CPBP family intramembrane glutamic endopeptidase [Marinobacter panjinensis]MCR8915070.1 CPBP family intramembrane metalloprotease [Marinobacter panjinensis]